ncbi:hypothetical protein CSQ88_18025 [Iodobacter sp. BJB302]|nr:hypothetical protein CSQ88_18025 [Iodobacter sp. BJB302]
MSNAKPYAAINIDLNQENVVLFKKLRDFPDGGMARAACRRKTRCQEEGGANQGGVKSKVLPP